MAVLTINRLALIGATTALAAASAGGDSFANPRGTAWLEVANGGGSPTTVTIAVGPNATRSGDGTFPPTTYSALAVTVAAGARKRIGPIPPVYNDGNGNVQVTYSGVTSLTVEACDLPA